MYVSMGITYAVVASIFWGLAYVIDQRVLSSIRPVEFMFISSLVGTVAYAPFVFYNCSGIIALITSSNGWSWLIASLLASNIASLAILHSIIKVNATVASFIEISYPFFVALFCYMLYNETFNVRLIIGGLMTIVGVLIMKA